MFEFRCKNQRGSLHLYFNCVTNFKYNLVVCLIYINFAGELLHKTVDMKMNEKKGQSEGEKGSTTEHYLSDGTVIKPRKLVIK